jgi:catechol 2,3-dioxygenase-like lactoylglutathione lyase family enzyme
MMQYLPTSQTSQNKGKFLSDARVSDRITHPGVVTSDIPANEKFYSDVLGFKETWRGSANDKVVSWINVKMPDSDDYIEYMLDKKTGPHFGLGVAYIEKAKAKLEASPYRSQYKTSFNPIVGKNNKRIINLTDPEGFRVELMEFGTIDGKPEQSTKAPLPK